MKQTDKNSKAPALTRGIAVMRFMDEDREYSLEELASVLDYPKSSLLRIMDVLAEENLLQRDPANKKYSLLTKLVSVSEFHFETRLVHVLKSLSATTGLTVEWYEYTQEGMLLTRQQRPLEQEVFVQAREGWLIPWNFYLNAVNCLGTTWFNEEGKANKYNAFTKDGEASLLPPKEITSRFAEARKNGLICDRFVNSCSVRRIAAVVTRHGAPLGIIALAEFVTRIHEEDQGKLTQLLQNAVSSLS